VSGNLFNCTFGIISIVQLKYEDDILLIVFVDTKAIWLYPLIAIFNCRDCSILFTVLYFGEVAVEKL